MTVIPEEIKDEPILIDLNVNLANKKLPLFRPMTIGFLKTQSGFLLLLQSVSTNSNNQANPLLLTFKFDVI